MQRTIFKRERDTERYSERERERAVRYTRHVFKVRSGEPLKITHKR